MSFLRNRGRVWAARAAAGLLLLTTAAAAPSAGGERLRVRLAEPDRADLLAGDAQLRATVEAAPGVVVERVEFLADGALLAVDADPPYRAAWRGIDPRRDHLLRVTAVAADGTRAYDLVSIPVLGLVSRTTVRARAPEFVLVDVTFLDEEGRPVVDVRRDEVRVLDGGARRTVELFEPDSRPLAAELLLDASSSTEPFWEQLARSTRLFAETLRPGDRAAVEAFHDLSHVIAAMGTPPGEMERAISGFVDWGGGTRLHDALTRAALFTLGGEETRRRALVLLTDADDQGSALSLDDAADYLRRGAIETHAALLRKPEEPKPRGRPRAREIQRAQRALTEVVESTGGAAYDAQALPMEEIFLRIGERLRAQYLLGFTSDPRRAGRERRIVVKLKRPGKHTAHAVGSHFAGRSLEEHLAGRIAAGPTTDRLVAIRAASMSRDPVTIRALVEAMAGGESADLGVAREARLALLGLRGAAIPYLLEGTAAGDRTLAARSARVLVEVMVLLVRSPRAGEVEEGLAMLGRGDAAEGLAALERLGAGPMPDGTRVLLEALLRHLRGE